MRSQLSLKGWEGWVERAFYSEITRAKTQRPESTWKIRGQKALVILGVVAEEAGVWVGPRSQRILHAKLRRHNEKLMYDNNDEDEWLYQVAERSADCCIEKAGQEQKPPYRQR